MRRFVWVFIAVFTAIINWFVFVRVGKWLEVSEPEFFATILLISVAMHEIGHMVVMEYYGVRTGIFFGVILGGAVPYSRESINTFYELNWHKMAGILLAGVAANIAIVIVTIGLYAAGILSTEHMFKIVNLNGVLALFNLLPFGILDGGKFAKVFFDSIPERRDAPFAVAMGIAVFIAAILLMQVGKNDPVLIGLIVWGLYKKATNDDLEGSYNEKAMTTKQQTGWAFAYTGLVVASTAALSCSMFIK